VRILARFAAGSRRDFGFRDFASWQESQQDSQQDPSKILAAWIFASRRESWQNLQQDPGKILTARNFAIRRESCLDSARIPAGNKNPSGQNLARTAEISTGCRQDASPYFTRDGFWSEAL